MTTVANANNNSERITIQMKKRNQAKKLLCLLLALLPIMFSAIVPTSAANRAIITPVSVVLDGTLILDSGTGEGALLIDAVTYVPLRRFCSIFGGEVSWDNSTRSAHVRSVGLDISVPSEKQYIIVNDRAFFCPSGIVILNGTLYVPVRVLAKAFGLEVEWRASNNGSVGYVELTSGLGRAEPASDVYDEEVLYWLSRIISAESRGESLMGQIAVGNVVLNRTRSDSFPDTVYDVIFDTKFGVQFTPAASGTIYEQPAESSVIAAKICLEGYTLSDDILYFLNEAISTNLWVSNNRKYIMTVGNHTFYS